MNRQDLSFDHIGEYEPDSYPELVRDSNRHLYGFLATLLILIPCIGCRSTSTTPAQYRQEIRNVLEEQANCWNAGDLEGYMNGYWQSSRLSFNGAGSFQRGWDQVLDNYRSRYPDAAAMGHLKLNRLEVNELGEDAAYVLGRWYVRSTDEYRPDDKGGTFTLVMRRIDGDWKIVHDHTSTDPDTLD